MINLEPSLLCLRGDVTSNWITFNPILTLNEPAIEIFNDGNVKMKVGNGVNNFLDLPYLNEADNVNADWNSTGGLSEILNKPTTVSGYAISDVYTINEVNFKILTIQEASNSTNGFMSINDFVKLSGISSGATKNDTDQNLKDRQNHTGTQLSNTISNFVESVNDSQLSEIYIDNADLASGDTVCSSINKLQSQNSNTKSNLSSHVNNINNPHTVTKTQIGLGFVNNTSDVNKPISTSTQNALNLKVDKTTNIVAGNGLTGGGILSGNTTINVVSLNDGILVNNDNIELKTIDNLTTVSSTKPLSASQGKVLNEKTIQLETDLNEINNLLADYTHTANKTVIVTSVDVLSGEFTSASQGFVNGDRIGIVIEKIALDKPALYYLPGGITPNSLYYIVEATANTFKLSSDSGGQPIILSTNENLNPNMFHFEKPIPHVTITNIPAKKNIRIIIEGGYPGGYVCPNGLGSSKSIFYETGNPMANRYSNITGSRVYCNADIYVSVNKGLFIKYSVFRMAALNITGNTTAQIDSYYYSPKIESGDISYVAFAEAYILNDCKIKIYKV